MAVRAYPSAGWRAETADLDIIVAPWSVSLASEAKDEPVKTILALTRYGPMGASSRVRFALYEDLLREGGYTLTASPFFDDAYLQNLYAGGGRPLRHVAGAFGRRLAALRKARNFDLLWIEKDLLPFAPGLFERLAGLAGVPYVVDFDDAVFHNYDQSGNPLIRGLLSNKFDPLLKRSAAITAGNRYLADYANSHGAAKVMILPTVVDTDRYDAAAAPPLARSGSGKIVIGWIGSPATARLLQTIVPILNTASRSTPFSLRTIGIAPLSGADFPIDSQPWTADTEVALLNGIDVGIMPLTDSPFERGKCGYKLIQYMALAKPVIASNVGVNGEIVTPEVGFLAENDRDWIDAIGRLAADPELRTIMGRAGRERCEALYSLRANAPRLIALFDGITAGRARGTD